MAYRMPTRSISLLPNRLVDWHAIDLGAMLGDERPSKMSRTRLQYMMEHNRHVYEIKYERIVDMNEDFGYEAADLLNIQDVAHTMETCIRKEIMPNLHRSQAHIIARVNFFATNEAGEEVPLSRSIGGAFFTLDYRRQRDQTFLEHLMKGLRGIVNTNWSSEDYTVYINGWEFLVSEMEEKAGGCRERHDIVRTVNGMVCVSKRSSNNTCFFASVLHFLTEEDKRRIGYPYCVQKNNEGKDRSFPCTLRDLLCFPKGDLVKLEDIPIMAEHMGIRIRVVDSLRRVLLPPSTMFTGKDTRVINILLDNGHYMAVENVDPPVCEVCSEVLGKKILRFNNDHKCVQKCEKCGRIFRNTHKCNPTRQCFYQRQIVKNKNAKVPRVLMSASQKSKRKFRPNPHDIDESFPLSPIDEPTKFLIYDIETYMETITDKLQEHKPYACGWMASGIHKEPEIDFGNTLHQVFEHMVNFLLENGGYAINAFNGARFDHLFLLRYLKQRDVPLEGYLVNNGRLLRCSWKAADGKKNHFFDLNQFLLCSLKRACEDFKVPKTLSKGDFDHSKIKKYEDVIFHIDEITDYLIHDVLSLEYLTLEFHSVMKERFHVDIGQFVTLSSVSDHVWRETIPSPIRSQVYLPKSVPDYSFFRSAVYGGRCYPAHKFFQSTQYDDILEGKVNFEDVNDFIFNADVRSLYPYAMLFDFPVGDYRSVTEEVPDAMGIYEVSFVCPKTLTHAILPRHNPKTGGLVWTLEDGKGVYTSIDIENARRFGYQITFLHGIVWDTLPLADRVSPLFANYIKSTYEWKKEFTETKGSQYTIAKLMMNSLYGKQLQRSDLTETKMCTTLNEFDDFMDKYAITDWFSGLNWVILKGDIINEDEMKLRLNRPTYLGAFILSYSRYIMTDYFNMIDPGLRYNRITYTDTDSLHFHSDFLPQVAAHLSTELGGLGNDCDGDGKIIKEVNLAPKMYMYTTIDKHGKIKTTRKCKGIPRKLLEELDYESQNMQSISYQNCFKRILHHVMKFQEREGMQPFSVFGQPRSLTFLKTIWAGRVERPLSENETVPAGFDAIEFFLQTEESNAELECDETIEEEVDHRLRSPTEPSLCEVMSISFADPNKDEEADKEVEELFNPFKDQNILGLLNDEAPFRSTPFILPPSPLLEKAMLDFYSTFEQTQ